MPREASCSPFPAVHPNDGFKIACICHCIATSSPQHASRCVVPHQPSSCLEEASDAVILSHLHKYSGYAVTITYVSSAIDPSNNVGVLLSVYTLGVNLWHRLKNKRWGSCCRKNNLQAFSSLVFQLQPCKS